MSKSSLLKGDIAEMKCAIALATKGYLVYKPVFSGSRSDLIIDKDGSFARLQCKHARLVGDCLLFQTSSVDNVSQKRRFYDNEIDAFAVYSSDLDKVYLVPIRDVAKYEGRLRVAGKTSKKSRLANNYEV